MESIHLSNPLALFEEIHDLRHYILKNNISLEEYTIALIRKSSHEEKSDTLISEEINLPVSVDIKINNFSDNPSVCAKLSESNVIFIDTSKLLHENIIDCGICILEQIDFLDRTLLTNICSENNKQYIHLDIEINRKMYYDTKFEIQSKKDDIIMTLDKSLYE